MTRLDTIYHIVGSMRAASALAILGALIWLAPLLTGVHIAVQLIGVYLIIVGSVSATMIAFTSVVDRYFIRIIDAVYNRT